MTAKTVYQIKVINEAVPPGLAMEGKYVEVPTDWVRCTNRQLVQVMNDYALMRGEFKNCFWLGRPCSAKSVRALKSVWNIFVSSVNELYEEGICRLSYDCAMATGKTDMVKITLTETNQDGLFGTLCRIYSMLQVAGCFFDQIIFSKLDGADEEINATNQEYGFLASFRCLLETQLEHLMV
jgi:hypothetical protein